MIKVHLWNSSLPHRFSQPRFGINLSPDRIVPYLQSQTDVGVRKLKRYFQERHQVTLVERTPQTDNERQLSVHRTVGCMSIQGRDDDDAGRLSGMIHAMPGQHQLRECRIQLQGRDVIWPILVAVASPSFPHPYKEYILDRMGRLRRATAL